MSSGGAAGRTGRVGRWLGWLVRAALVAGPLVAGALSGPPSLFDDDLIRVGSLRRLTLGQSLGRPFNEHLAPVFELVGWGAWWASGQQVDRIALAFQVAALLATGLMVLALGWLVRLELRSAALGWLAAGLLAWPTATSEVALWYSASSFAWAAALTLATLIAAYQVRFAPGRRRQSVWLAATAALALLAPLASAVGVLAGPLAALRLALANGTADQHRAAEADPPLRWWASLMPLVGTLVFGGLLLVGPGGSAVAGTVRARLDPLAAAWAALQAPGLVLIPALGGFDPLTGRLDDWVAAGASGVVGGVVVRRLSATRRHRAIRAVGLALVVGGYALTYLPRTQRGDAWIFAVGRYHLFPTIGAILLIVAGLPALRPLRGQLTPGGRLIGLALALSVLVVLGAGRFAPRWQRAAAGYRFAEQAVSLAAALQLEAACRLEGVPLAQAIRVIPPTLPRWFPRPAGFHPLLYLFGPDGPDAHHPDSEAGPRVLGRLTIGDREALFAALDVERAGFFRAGPPEPGEHDLLFQSPGDGRDRLPTGGLIYWREFDLRQAQGPTRALGLRQGAAQRQEVWWLGADGRWTPQRSVVWATPGDRDWATLWLDLARLPHWQAAWGRRVRLVRRDRPWPVDPDRAIPHLLEVRTAGEGAP